MKLVPGSSSALWKNLRNTFGKLWWQECNRWQLEERLDDVIKCKCDEAFSKVHPQEQELNCLSKAAVKNFKKDVKRAFKKKSQLSRDAGTSNSIRTVTGSKRAVVALQLEELRKLEAESGYTAPPAFTIKFSSPDERGSHGHVHNPANLQQLPFYAKTIHMPPQSRRFDQSQAWS